MCERLAKGNIGAKWFFDKAGLLALILLLLAGCANNYPLIRHPDIAKFDSTVVSSALRDSLRHGKLVPGMPYFVASQIFDAWRVDRQVPVPSLGSKQRLREVEGWGREFMDPTIQVFFDQYRTKNGKLALWYQFPDFYRVGVSEGDTLFVFWQDSVSHSVVQCLLDPFRLAIRDRLSPLSSDTTIYGEIHHHDNPKRQRSYWYNLVPLDDGLTFILESMDFEFYPIELIEVDGKRVTSFPWR